MADGKKRHPRKGKSADLIADYAYEEREIKNDSLVSGSGEE